MRPRALAVLALLLLLATSTPGSRATFSATSTAPRATFSLASDWVAPAVTVAWPADGSYTTNTAPLVTGTAGTASGDLPAVTLRVYAGASATGTPLRTLAAARSGDSWSVALATLPDGRYTLRATQDDSAGATGSATVTFTIDTASPAATSISAANAPGGTAGLLDAGDTITFAYSEAIDPASVLAGWNGAATDVKLRFNDTGSNDGFTVLDAAGAATVGLGSVASHGDYVSSATTFDATMARSADGSSVVVTLGTPTSVAATPFGGKNMRWSVDASVTDLAGNAVSGSTLTESDSDQDF